MRNPSSQNSNQRKDKSNDTFLDLLVDPGLLPVGVGLGLGDSGGVRVASEKSPANFDATQHFVPSNGLATENYRTSNLSEVLSDT